MTPLNGLKTHPLSDHEIDCLRRLAIGPDTAQELNPGVYNRLCREALIESYHAGSPYKTNKGKSILWVRITDAGRAVLAMEARS